MSKGVFILLIIWTQVSCMQVEYKTHSEKNFEAPAGSVRLVVSFPVYSENVIAGLKDFVAKNGGRYSPLSFASKRIREPVKKKDIVPSSSDFYRIQEAMIFDKERLERFLSGFGDPEFKNSVVSSVRRDIEILEDEFDENSLTTLDCVKEVLNLLTECDERK